MSRVSHDLNEFKTSYYPKIVDYTATWCGPCKKIAPVYEQLAVIHSHVNFFKIDIDQYPEQAEEAGVTSVPTFIFYKNENSKPIVLKGANQDELVRITSLIAS